MVTLCVFHTNIKHVKRLVICSHWRLIASYHAMTHNNDVQTVHTRQTWSVCKPRPRLVFKARPLLVQFRQTPGLYLRPGLYSRKCGMLPTALIQYILSILQYAAANTGAPHNDQYWNYQKLNHNRTQNITVCKWLSVCWYQRKTKLVYSSCKCVQIWNSVVCYVQVQTMN